MRISAFGTGVRVASLTLVVASFLAGQVQLARAQSAPESWSKIADLMTARARQSATVLNDGRVLIAGGDDSSGVLATAEIFDPATGSLQPTMGPMAEARKNHRAVLLKDGRVLLIGGENATGVLATAEAFDPWKGTFTPVGKMSQARRFHTATLLNDGTVLVAGGEDRTGQALNSLEVFDPESNSFRQLGVQLDSPRAEHTATLLEDGRVIVAGGRNGSTALATTLYFDPATNSVSLGLFLAEARYAHTATVVLWGNVVFAGGTADGKAGIDLVELLDVHANRMAFTQNRISVGRWNHSAIVPPNNGNLILVGGRNGSGPLAAADILDPESFLSSPLPNLLSVRSQLSTFPTGKGKVCAAGGDGQQGPLTSIETSRHATIVSDRADYPPNTTVNLSGSDWLPGEQVILTIRQSDGDPDTVFTLTADADGNISNSGFQTDIGDKHKAFLVKAVGGASSRTAYTRFTDLGATITLNPSAINVTSNPVTLQISGSGFSLGSNNACFYQSSNNGLISCSPQVIYVSDSQLNVAVPSYVAATPGGYNVQVQQSYYVYQQCCYTTCWNCGWNTCCGQTCYNCGYYTTFYTSYASLAVNQIATNLSVSSLTTSFGSSISVSAILTDASSNPLANQTVQLTLPGSLSASATTDSTGTATTSLNLGSLPAGNYAGGIQASFAGNLDYIASSAQGNLVVNQVTPAVSWPTPAPIVYGTMLSFAQLNATATGAGGAALPGTFSYRPAAGSLLPAGTATLSLTFTPADTTDYTPVSQTVNLVVNPAVPALAWSTPSPITYGTPLSPTELNATASGVGGTPLPGTFTYTPASGTVLGAGINPLSVLFVPADTSDYTSIAASVNQIVTTAATTTTLTFSSNTVTAGTPVALTAMVSAGGSTVTPGQVTFCDANAPSCVGTGVLGVAALTSGGAASLNLILGPGQHRMFAVFAGTTNYSGSASGPQNLTVDGINPSATLISSAGSAGNYTLTATVAGSGTLAPTGAVSFPDATNNNLSLGAATLGSGLTTVGFTPAPTLSAGNGATTAVVGDFNGDGRPDVAIVNATDATVSIFLGNGDGTFNSLTPVPVGANPSAIAAGDFNGDGKLDLAVANNGANSVTILLGNGDGTFTAAVPVSVGNSPSAIVVGDFDGDGNQDLAVANSVDNSVTLALGNGDGTFGRLTTLSTGLTPVSLAVADFNGDGKLDLATGNSGDQSVTILLNTGNLTFAASSIPNAGALEIAVGDFNGDGKVDLAVVNLVANSVTILLGNGDGTFTTAAPVTAGNQPSSAGVGDFNADGKQDLAIGNYGDNTVSILLGNGDGTFTLAATEPAGSKPKAMVLGDFNGDAKTDVVTVNIGNSTATVLLGNPSTVATATLSGVSAWGGGSHNVSAGFPGDTNYSASSSSTTLLAGTPITTTIAFSISPATALSYGQSVQFTVSVSPATTDNYAAGGSVTFYDGTTALGTVNLSAGQAVFNTSSLGGGSHSLTASYSGDTNFAPIASSATTVSINPVSAALIWNAPSAISYGMPLTASQLNATATGVGGNSLPGTFTYNPLLGTVLGAGTRSLSVTFVPADSVDYSSASLTVNLPVNQAGTNVALTSGTTPQLAGNPVTFTATVASMPQGAPVPSGTVTFNDGATALGSPVTLNGSGVASFTTSSLAVGSHSIIAAYSGNANEASSLSAALTEMIEETTTTVLTSSANPILSGNSVTLTATVNPAASGTPSGRVTFKDGTTTLGAATLNASGTATISIATLAVAAHSITAIYSGDPSNLASTSAAVNEIVQENISISFASSANPSLVGNAVSLTASVSGSSSGVPTGTVTFKDGATTLGSATLNGSGVATLSSSTLALGQHSITAVYGGDALNLSGTSGVFTETVEENTSTVLVSGANPIFAGSAATLTATVTPGASGTPTGTVTFKDGTTSLGTATLNALSVATFSVSTIAAGSHSLTAVYSGDTINLPSSSAAMTETVNPANFTLTANPGSQSVTDGQSATYTLTLTPEGMFGSPINFSCSGLPVMANCVFSPGSVTPNSSTVTTTLTITTVGRTAPAVSAWPRLPGNRPTFYVLGALAELLVLLGFAWLNVNSAGVRRMRRAVTLAGLLLIVVGSLAACAGSSKPITPRGASQVQVTASSSGANANVSHSVGLTLAVE
jgi:hypothetical protein